MPERLQFALRAALLGILLVFAGPVFADESVKRLLPEAEKVGEGRLTYLFWDVYDAALYAPQGTYDPNRPFALKLTYLMDFKGRDIAGRSIEEMRAQGVRNEAKLTAWDAEMQRIFPDVKDGDSLLGIQTEDGIAIFYDQVRELGRVADADFSRAFFDIWLAENTRAPKLRRSLLSLP